MNFFSQEVKKIEKDYINYCGEYFENINSNIYKTFYVNSENYICDISSDGEYCQVRQLKYNEKKRSNSFYLLFSRPRHF